VVDDIRVSSYVYFQDSNVMVIGGYRTFPHYHCLAYLFETPHQIASQLGIGRRHLDMGSSTVQDCQLTPAMDKTLER
jgi:hypothetical protein